MPNSDQPTCYVIAGPNGAGKTTFALGALPGLTGCRRFLNADLIAYGLQPLGGEPGVDMRAGRIFLEQLADFIEEGRSFAFETTLAGRGHVRTFERLRRRGFRIELYYLWLPNEAFSAARVRQRVRNGGHDVPLPAIQRRYTVSLRNLLNDYAPRADYAEIIDSSSLTLRVIAAFEGDQIQVSNRGLFDDIVGRSTA